MEVAQPLTPGAPPVQTPPPSHQRRSSAAKSVNSVHSASKSPSQHPPSPEVISSLISSLAGIATPGEESRPGSQSSKSPTPTQRSRAVSKAASHDKGLNRQGPLSPLSGMISQNHVSRPADGVKTAQSISKSASAPIVRLARPRITTSRSQSKTPTRRESPSVSPLVDKGRFERRGSEQGTASSPAVGAPSRNTNISNLLKKKSRDAFVYGQKTRSTSKHSNLDSLSPLAVNFTSSSSRGSLTEKAVNEKLAAWYAPASPQHAVGERRSSLNAVSSRNSPISDSAGPTWSSRLIPSRRSSLQHGSGSKRSSKIVEEVKEDVNPDDDLEGADSTVKRIRELQKRKEKRERDQRREERREERRERKRLRNSMPGLPGAERSGNRNSRHTIAETAPRNAERPVLTTADSAPVSGLGIYARRRVSTSLSSPGPATLHSRAASPGQEFRPSFNSRPMTPRSVQRIFSDSQRSPARGSFGDRPRSTDSLDLVIEMHVTSQRLTQKVRQPQSGRVVAFSEVGDPHGFPVICCVGMGMTRYAMAFYEELATSLRLRLITIDRPGVGESEACSDGTGTPLNWPDDVALVCQALSLSRFSLLAHSAGAIYALATALRLPHMVRGRIQLLAPWIPPSQMSALGSHKDASQSSSLPYAQKLLRVLPTALLRAANSHLISSTPSNKLNKSPRWTKRKSMLGDLPRPSSSGNGFASREPFLNGEFTHGDLSSLSPGGPDGKENHSARASPAPIDENYLRARQNAYDTKLTQRIWELAQRNGNPAIDLIICLERERSIGFCYVDVTRPCVVRHGSRDTRVRADNVKWLGKKMRRCEVRLLEGEGHSLMANASVMGEVLTEVAREWEDWARITREGKSRKMSSAVGLI